MEVDSRVCVIESREDGMGECCWGERCRLVGMSCVS